MFRVVCLLMLAMAMSAPTAWADGQARYIHLEPAFVLNYGSTGRMKYLRTEVALLVRSPEAASQVSRHRPYIRNNLVMLMSAQEPDIMNTAEGRESLRQVALDEVRALMLVLEGNEYVEELYFNNFVVQN